MDQNNLLEIIKYEPENGTFERLKRTSSNAAIGGINKHGYRVISVCGKPFYAHRLAWLYMTGDWPKGQIDHINGNRSDNRWCNLRDVSLQKNQQNLNSPQKNNTTGLLGVCYMGENRRGKKYAASIYRNGVKHNLGYFETPEEAHVAYMNAKRNLDNA